jgi:hypothetical protein
LAARSLAITCSVGGHRRSRITPGMLADGKRTTFEKSASSVTKILSYATTRVHTAAPGEEPETS